MEHNAVQQMIARQFSRTLWNPMRKAIKDYELIAPGDHIAVCISGGKDSMLLACMLARFHTFGGIPFELTAISMDPGYTPDARHKIEENLHALGLHTHWYETKLFEAVNKQTDNPCFLCARLRRGSLYAKAQELGCNKIALGHHFDDVIETTLMSMLYGGQIQTMLPKIKAKNYEPIQVIRPLYFVRERDILAWRDACGLEFLACSCDFAHRARQNDTPESSKRYEVKRMIAALERDNAQVPKNIFNALKNVNVSDILGWHQGNDAHSFLDEFHQP